MLVLFRLLHDYQKVTRLKNNHEATAAPKVEQL